MFLHLLVEDESRVAAAPEAHGLAAVPTVERQSELCESAVEFGEVSAPDLDEVDPLRRLGVAYAVLEPLVSLRRAISEPDQRSARMCGRARHIRLAEGVVEDFQRKRARVSRSKDMREERGEIEGTLARKQSVVTAPEQHVHVERRGVGKLQEEDLVAVDRLDLREIMSPREDVEAVEADTEVGPVRELDDAPRVPVVIDVATPGERLVCDADAVLGCAISQFSQLTGGHIVVADGRCRDVAAHEQKVGADPLHDLELGFGAP